MALIYKITNLVNGKQYVGYTTKTIEERFNQHWASRFTDNAPIHRAMIKFGKKNFVIESIEQILTSQWNEKEQYWIEKLKTFAPFGYNICQGGQGKPPVHCGEDNNKAKLTTVQLYNLINDLKEYELEFGQIAKKYKISQSQVERINKGEYWNSDEFEYPIRKEKRDYYILKQIVQDLKENILSQDEIERKYLIKSRTRLYNINTGKVGKKILPQENYPIRDNIVSRKPLYLCENL